MRKRVIGCFKGLATGDAVGKQTETLGHADIATWYPDGIRGFEGRPGDVIPRYLGKRYEWRIGEFTDDTEQTLAVTRAILRVGAVRHEAVGRELLTCRKSLHPGVSLWAFVQSGDAARIAPDGDGCGAAMRVAPVGVLSRTDRLEELVDAAYEVSIPTHGGTLAIGAAAAVAGAVSAGLEGRTAGEVLQTALRAARLTEGSAIADSIEKMHDELRGLPLTAGAIAQRYFPDNPLTIVPLAIALAVILQSVEQVVLLASNIGGDTDSVASIGGAICGAMCPETVNDSWFDTVAAVNAENIIDAAESLAALVWGRLQPERTFSPPSSNADGSSSGGLKPSAG